ncbi:MAG: hypothetical protein EAZ95_07505 [Bacteroidetes bacterium]|nr:MAG: hypothetical protein EAZ95_07505 [Bacteroidota bacterium]
MQDSNEWDIKIPTEGDLESRLRAVERQLAGQVKEFIFVLDADTGEELYRDKGTFGGIFDTIALQNVLNSRRVIIITHNHPKETLDFSVKDLNLFFNHDNVVQLRATSGGKTAILSDKDTPKPYKQTRELLINAKIKERLRKEITQTQYELWYDTVLPYELQEVLSLQINVITL